MIFIIGNLFISFVLHTHHFSFIHAATFQIQNHCSYTVWAAALPGGGGKRLDPQQSWPLQLNPGKQPARIWARTNCNFNGAGRGHCETGDCLPGLQCQAPGAPPQTVAEFLLNQYNNLNFFDISLLDAFNVPMEVSPTSNGCKNNVKCAADIKGQCPKDLKVLGGCNNPCTVFKNEQYCCTSGKCEPNKFTQFFKDRCPDAHSYGADGSTGNSNCPSGTNYKVVFCP